jgi:hypothetical protein
VTTGAAKRLLVREANAANEPFTRKLRRVIIGIGFILAFISSTYSLLCHLTLNGPKLQRREENSMQKLAEQIHGYTYGTSEVATSPVTLQQLEALKVSVGFTEEDQRYLQQAGTVLADQTKQIVEHWRSGIIARIPNFARH